MLFPNHEVDWHFLQDHCKVAILPLTNSKRPTVTGRGAGFCLCVFFFFGGGGCGQNTILCLQQSHFFWIRSFSPVQKTIGDAACHDLEAIFTDPFGAGFLHRSLGVLNVGAFGGVPSAGKDNQKRWQQFGMIHPNLNLLFLGILSRQESTK